MLIQTNYGRTEKTGNFVLLHQSLTPLRFPTNLFPLALMRPLSGSTTLALLTDMVHRFGPDNIVSLTAATILTETTLLRRGGLHWNCGNKTSAACAACDPGGFPGRSHGMIPSEKIYARGL